MGGQFDANPFGELKGSDNPHVVRYLIARGFIKPGETVLDAGCGTGYGSMLLGESAGTVLAVDADENFREEWKSKNVEFSRLHLGKEELPDVDSMVCIECAEHINGLEHFIQQAQKHV